MFSFVLVILSYSNTASPDPIATFKTKQMCDVVAYITNTGFVKNNMENKAVCIYSNDHGDI